MNLFPKKKTTASKAGEEEHVWDELPPPPSFDAEDEWAKEGSKRTRQSAGTHEPEEQSDWDDEGEALRLSVRRTEPSVLHMEIEPVSPVPPDARLLIDDLRLEEADALPHETKKMHFTPARWVFYAGLCVMVVILVTLGFFTMLNESNPRVNPLGIPPLIIEQEEAYPIGEHIADLLARKDEAIDLFGRFLQADSAGELLGMVRPVPGIEMLVGNPHRPEGLPPGWQVPADAKWDVHTDQDPIFGVLSGYYPDESKFHAFFLLKNGRLVLDWKATVGHGSVPFSKLVEGLGDASEVRVWVEPATFYSAAYPESDYRSYKIHRSLDDPAVWAFARRGTVPDQELARMFHKSMFGGARTKTSMVLLSLVRGPGDAAPNQWMITDLLHTAWVLP
jgi:hypothetical protein